MLIAIYTLTQQRDRFIDQMLAEELRKFGHEVVIRSYIHGARESITYEKPDVVVMPFPGGEYKMDTIEKCKEWGIEVIVRRGEAGMGIEQFIELDDNRKKLIMGNWDYSPYVDLELVWGQEFKTIINFHGHMPGHKMRACGAFAFDPYFVPDIAIHPDRKKTILFATGFSTADCRPGYCETGLPEGSSYHEELHDIHRVAREGWLRAIHELVRCHKDEWDFELKVRPGETPVVYADKVPSCVKIHPEGASSSEVLKTIDVLVHSGSTLAIEAHLLGIPSINFCNVNPDPLLSKVSPSAYFYDELEFLISRAIPGQTNIHQPVLDELIDHLYGYIDGKACERAAKYIEEYFEYRRSPNSRLPKKIPDTWPEEAKYFVGGGKIHLEKQEGDFRWSCPCCRVIFWGEEEATYNCPYCNMKIDRTTVKPGEKEPSRKRAVVSSLLK